MFIAIILGLTTILVLRTLLRPLLSRWGEGGFSTFLGLGPGLVCRGWGSERLGMDELWGSPAQPLLDFSGPWKRTRSCAVLK